MIRVALVYELERVLDLIEFGAANDATAWIDDVDQMQGLSCCRAGEVDGWRDKHKLGVGSMDGGRPRTKAAPVVAKVRAALSVTEAPRLNLIT